MICLRPLLVATAVVIATLSAPAKAASLCPKCNELQSSLSSEAAFQLADVNDWVEQCVRPFADLDIPTSDFPVSNYQLFEQPSGLCQNTMTCAYENCGLDWGVPMSLQAYNSTDAPDDSWFSGQGLDLPDAVVHPKHARDISATIKFAIKYKIGLSVKTTGHSYTGSSTKKGTILLNLSKLQKYSSNGGLIECDASVPPGAYQDACTLAKARSKDAVLRVGGGEIFDEALRAVNIEWNENNNNKYHLVTGGAGTVSAAGGWLASGGLSGTTGMRLFGVGVDQVLHVEMVLPTGEHVRFGPTAWEEEAGMMYPRTTEVGGYCNRGDLSDEGSWDWRDCEEDINFKDLWFAVRGGGGGTYGVVTSIYYQLHEYSPIEFVTVNVPSLDEESLLFLMKKWIEFVLRFLWDPKSIGVEEEVSNSCMCSDDGGIIGRLFYCYNGAGEKMKNAWKSFYGDETGIDEYFTIERRLSSYAQAIILEGMANPNVPEGRANDSPAATVTPYVYSVDSKSIIEFLVFPAEVIPNKIEELVEMFFECYALHALSGTAPICLGSMYTMGGVIPSADDGMNALPIHRRQAAFLMMVTDLETRNKFHQLFYGVSDGEPVTGDSYPGGLCHNHVSMNFPTPLKTDWTKGCDPSWSKEKKEEMCLSFQETAWGTDVLAKLERIHTSVDPHRLFQCTGCVGYTKDESRGGPDDPNGASQIGYLFGTVLSLAAGLIYLF